MANTLFYDPSKLTLASNYHKLGTILKLTNFENGRVIFVSVTDHTADWVARANRIDGTPAVWSALGLDLKRGIVLIQVDAVPNTAYLIR
jgi:hypothetical protein